ncbi:MAG: hypothetical protein H6730_36190 [Deltaproteobacteria bacterium]|nr:hypothetical protein [Deltaproteobacteria bacterium]
MSTVEAIAHPIAEDIAAAIVEVKQPGREPAELPRAAAKALARKIDGYLESPELFDVVKTVLYASHLLETEAGAPRAAKAVLDLVERGPVLKALRRHKAERSAADTDAAGTRGRAFVRFTDRAPARPASPAPSPKGAVPLAFAFPRRM